MPPTIHASAVKVGPQAILIRGASGAGKSRLAFDLILAGLAGQIPATLLLGDDRICLAREGDAIIARPAPTLAGLIEIRGLGIRRCAFAGEAPVGLVVDLAAEDGGRLPGAEALRTTLLGIEIPRIPVMQGEDALRLIVAALVTGPGTDAPALRDCRKGFGNHITPTIATD